MDYQKIGVIIGLELHQQIDGHKLFCKCPCIVKDTMPDYEIKRKLRVSASEIGDFDPAALYELQKGKYFVYNGYNELNCLVELDESPPEELNEDALKIALQVSLLLNAKPVDEIQFMRKIVIDGSNVSGFQRTALIAIDGYIDTSEGIVNIPTICLEEESAKKIEDTNDYRKYNISRLCIPLVEIATAPDIKTPQQAKETAEKIGMILRSVNGIKRGLGSIRQDVNLSICNGARVEIKGFQELRSMPKVIEYEIERQVEELKTKKKLEAHVRKAEPNFVTSYLRPMPGSARMYPETDVPKIKITKKLLEDIKVPELISSKLEKIQEIFEIPHDLAKEITENGINIESYINDYRNVDPILIARVLVEIPKEIKSRFNLDINKITDDNYREILKLLDIGKINKNNVLDCFVELINNKNIDFNKYKTVSNEELEKEIKKIVENNPHVQFGGLMGDVMKHFKGKVDGKKVSEIIRKYKN